MPIFSGSMNAIGNYRAAVETNEANERIAAENLKYQREANEANLQFQREANSQNIQLQRDINNQNIAFQRETNAQNEALMREQWGREDTSYQRTIADMQAVGMSPLAMQGLNGGGQQVPMNATQVSAPQVSPEHTEALHNDFKHTTVPRTIDLGLLETFNAIKGAVVEGKKLNLEEDKLDETVRHNKESEKGMSAKNRLENRILDFIEGKLRSAVANGQTETDAKLDKWIGGDKAVLDSMSQEEKDALESIFGPEAVGKVDPKKEKKRVEKKAKEYVDRYKDKYANEHAIGATIGW